MKTRYLLLIAGIFAVACGTPSIAQTLTREPEMGTLREGQRVLVDDGSCPAGKIKEVIGGNHVEVGGTKRVKRIRRCITKR